MVRTLFVHYFVSRKYILMKDHFRRVKTRIRAKIEDFYSRPGIVKRILRVLMVTLLCIFSSIAILIIAVWLGMFGEIPSRNDLTSFNHQVATEIFSADSVLLGTILLAGTLYGTSERSYACPQARSRRHRGCQILRAQRN